MLQWVLKYTNRRAKFLGRGCGRLDTAYADGLLGQTMLLNMLDMTKTLVRLRNSPMRCRGRKDRNLKFPAQCIRAFRPPR